MVEGVLLVCSDDSIRWLVSVVWIVILVVFVSRILFIMMMFGFCCSRVCMLLVKFRLMLCCICIWLNVGLIISIGFFIV